MVSSNCNSTNGVGLFQGVIPVKLAGLVMKSLNSSSGTSLQKPE